MNTDQRYASGPVTARYQRGVHAKRLGAASPLVGYAVAVASLLTAVLFAALKHATGGMMTIPSALVGTCGLALAAWLAGKLNGAAGRPRSSGLRKGLLAQLTPVFFLSAAFPLAEERLRAAAVGSVSVAALVLAGSLATPWLSQAVCTPLFTALSAAPVDGEPASLVSRWISRWPFVAVSSLPVAEAFGAGIGVALGWNRAATGALVLLCMLNSLFGQSLVVGILRRNYLPWAVAWFAYALMLVAVPALWFLPPVAGLFTQLAYMLSSRPALVRPVVTRGLLTQFGKGMLVGAVLWGDKLFFFLKEAQHFEARLVFLAVLPAIVSYGYYFTRLAPSLDKIAADMRATMENDSLARSRSRLRELADQVEESIVQVACVAALLCLLSVIAVSFIEPSVSLLYAAMAVASTSFLVVTVLLYMLDYAGRTDLVYRFSGVHLALVVLVIVMGPPGPGTYLVLAALSAGVAVAAARSVLAAWRMSEYSLFWRYAAEW